MHLLRTFSCVPPWQHLKPVLKHARPRRNGQHFTDDIFKCIFFNENVWISIKISLTFVPKGPIYNIPALVPIMAWRLPGNEPLSEPMMDSLLMHICITRPQWVRKAYKEWLCAQMIRFTSDLILLFTLNFYFITSLHQLSQLQVIIECCILMLYHDCISLIYSIALYVSFVFHEQRWRTLWFGVI